MGTKTKLAYIHSILTGATVDGPGVRYVIFFQMCPLRCKYCHNPDTWAKNSLGIKTLESVLADILKYKSFFNFSGGGVTASGGEPLLQAEFCAELFKKLKENSIHTALDTCGCVEIDNNVISTIDYTDLVLLDIKHTDTTAHKDLTGKDNEAAKEFLKYLYKRNKKVWIRQVIVPGYTAEVKYIEGLIDYLKDYRSIIEKAELLPYHKMGQKKWEKLGLKYPLNVEPPDRKTLETIREMFEKAGYETLLS